MTRSLQDERLEKEAVGQGRFISEDRHNGEQEPHDLMKQTGPLPVACKCEWSRYQSAASLLEA